jgi:DNA helicase-2/ATP-dependent DNA helicase PcrA
MPDLVSSLNAEQQAAVCLPDAHALILAGAGSGKTRVLTTRIAWLIAQGRALPQQILAVTFTNKAAKEMKERLAAMVPQSLRGLWAGTFHGLSNRLLRLHWREAGLPEAFQILDSADQLSSVKRLAKQLKIDDERWPPKDLAAFINAQKEKGLRARRVEAADEYTRVKADFYAEYERQCTREGVADFAELLLRACELLEGNEALRLHYQGRFTHILVDEFQDTNRLQYRWLKLLAGDSAHLFAVGDDDQSIYAFRGAEVENMKRFAGEFAGKNIIRLERNYRSWGPILDAANALIAHNEGRLGKNLWTDAGAGAPIELFEAPTDAEEASFVADEAAALLEGGLPASQVAVLYRSNAQSRVLEHAFFSRGMAYRVYGGLRFFERQEVKHALAYLRLIANPDDDGAFLRVVNFPARGIGVKTLEKLQASALAQNCSLYNAVASQSGRSASALANFVRLIEAMRHKAHAENLALPDLIGLVAADSGLADFYRKDPKDGADRLENLDELVSASIAFLAEEPDSEEPASSPLVAFLAHALLESGERQAEAGMDAVQLMTVHAAKGLEFDSVFITGLEEGLFPHDNAKLDPEGLAEERRLMYVAITRAKKRLWLSYAQYRLLHGQPRYGLPSRFLGELPQELLRRRGAKPAFAASQAAYAPRRPAYPGATPAAPASQAMPRWAAAASLGNGLALGMAVVHPKFGEGVIVGAEGRNVQVRFASVGEKWLALDVARLTPAA